MTKLHLVVLAAVTLSRPTIAEAQALYGSLVGSVVDPRDAGTIARICELACTGISSGCTGSGRVTCKSLSKQEPISDLRCRRFAQLAGTATAAGGIELAEAIGARIDDGSDNLRSHPLGRSALSFIARGGANRTDRREHSRL